MFKARPKLTHEEATILFDMAVAKRQELLDNFSNETGIRAVWNLQERERLSSIIKKLDKIRYPE